MEKSVLHDSVMQTTRHVPFTPNEIYSAFADPTRLSKWWGPNGFTNTFHHFDFRAGGKWTFIMHAPNGANFPNENMFDEIEPNKKVVIRHISQPHFTLTVLLSPNETGTKIDWIQVFDDSIVAAGVRHIVEPANEQNLDRLENVLREERN